MATYSRKLKDSSGNYIAPATRGSCVYLNDNMSLQVWIDSIDLKIQGLNTTIDSKIQNVESKLENIPNTIYPVGAIYQSSQSTSPASLFGGEWIQIWDRFLYAAGSKAVGTTGGEENHTLSIEEMPWHNHNVTFYYQNNGSPGNSLWSPSVSYAGGVMNSTEIAYTAYTGSGWAHNNMPPYEVVYIWKRTA